MGACSVYSVAVSESLVCLNNRDFVLVLLLFYQSWFQQETDGSCELGNVKIV